ncbi:MAG: CHAD domain-containing protein [Gaiellaceae bacterium]
MRETKERELKLVAPDEFGSVEELGEPIEDSVFTSIYYDTRDRALASAGVTLRRRLENGKSLWQLKLPGRGFRRELELPAGPARPPRALREPLFALLRGNELEQAATLKTRRSGVRMREDGRDRAEIVVDSVAVMDNGRVRSTFREIEVELIEGDPSVLDRIGKALRRKGALASDGRPKLFRALGLAPPPSPEPKTGASAVPHVAAMLERQRREILAHDPGVRVGVDPEDVHAVRVAVRRSRAVLRAARPLLDQAVSEPIRAELKWLGSTLGPVRDLDVLLERLRTQLDALPADDRFAAERLLQLLSADRELARAQLLGALESERYLALLDRLADLAAEPAASGREKPLRALAARQFERLREEVARLPGEPSDTDLHSIRVRAKRARYAAELAEATVGQPAARFVARAKSVRDVIGEHQDAVVAAHRIQEALGATRGSHVAFAAGRLVEREEQRRLEARVAFPKAWRRLDKRGRRAWR